MASLATKNNSLYQVRVEDTLANDAGQINCFDFASKAEAQTFFDSQVKEAIDAYVDGNNRICSIEQTENHFRASWLEYAWDEDGDLDKNAYFYICIDLVQI